MSLSDLTNLTGMPSGKKKTHRGKRSRGFGAKGAMAHQHHTALSAAMESGDHKAAKSSAFHLVNALHALSRPKAATMVPSPPNNPGQPMPDGDGLSMNSPNDGTGRPSPFFK